MYYFVQINQSDRLPSHCSKYSYLHSKKPLVAFQKIISLRDISLYILCSYNSTEPDLWGWFAINLSAALFLIDIPV